MKTKELCYVPTRHVLVVLFLFGFIVTQLIQLSLNVTIVAMVHPSVWGLNEEEPNQKSCPAPGRNDTANTEQAPSGELMWDPQTQGIILGAMFYGSVFTHVIGGRLAERFGGKWLFGCSLFLPSLLSFLIPTAARLGSVYMIVVRVLQGVFEGVVAPSFFTLLSVWAPKKERNTFASIAVLGGSVGGAITMILAGYISSSPSLGGWPSVFYLAGAVGCVWFFFWSLLVHSTPEDHPRISKEELKYIKESLPEKTHDNENIPWRRVLTSIPLWSAVVFRTTTFWEYNTNSSALPLYLESALHLPVQMNGLVMGLQFASAALGNLVGGVAADQIRRKTKLRITIMHKGFSIVGVVLSVTSLVLIPQARCSILWVVVLLNCSKFFHTMCIGCVQVLLVDMAPQYAGTLTGIIYTTADCTGFLSPLLTGAITESDVSIHQWSYVFYINCGIAMFGLLLFTIFGSAERQPWALEEPSEQSPLMGHATKKTLKIPF